MNTAIVSFVSVTLLTLLLYFISRKNIDNLYIVLKSIFRKDSVVYMIISILFFPGTLIHELSHALMARLLFLKIINIRLIPQWKRNSIILGTVTYVKRGRLSNVIVGIAPIFGGMATLVWIASLHIFPSRALPMNLLLGYLIVAISSNMFSSKQDLVDSVYALPVMGFLIIFAWLLFKYIDLHAFNGLFLTVNAILNPVLDMLIFALFCQAVLYVMLYASRKILRR